MKAITKKMLFGMGCAGAYYSLVSASTLKNEAREFEEAVKRNLAEPLKKVEGFALRQFPWEHNVRDFALPENWEFRKVKLRGALSQTTQLVYRERNGEKGYLVFKALYTSADNIVRSSLIRDLDPMVKKTGIMVNLGWVPHSKIPELGFADVSYIKKIEEDSELPYLFPQTFDPATGFVSKAATEDDVEFPFEGFEREEVWVTGYLRRGEKPNFYHGRQFWGNGKLNSLIDLERMIAHYNIANIGSGREYYIEFAVNQASAKIAENDIVLPSSFKESKDELDQIARDYTKESSFYRKMALGWSAASAFVLLI